MQVGTQVASRLLDALERGVLITQGRLLSYIRC